MIDLPVLVGLSGGLCCLLCSLLFVGLVAALLLRPEAEVDPLSARRAGQRAAERIGEGEDRAQ